jgi:uncharacterized protein with HEPN domain
VSDRDDAFVRRPRTDPSEDTAAPGRKPGLEEALADLLAECSQIVEFGRDRFVEPRSLTYRAAEAVVIHFDDLLDRLPPELSTLLPADLERHRVRATRNVLSHDYRAANKRIVWDAIEHRIPAAISRLLDG